GLRRVPRRRAGEVEQDRRRHRLQGVAAPEAATTLSRPPCFAAYRALSADDISACSSAPFTGQAATPMLTVTQIDCSEEMAIGVAAMAPRMRSAAIIAPCASVSGSSTANPSPP